MITMMTLSSFKHIAIAAAFVFSVLFIPSIAAAQNLGSACGAPGNPSCGIGLVCVDGTCEESARGSGNTDFGVGRIEGGDEPIQLGSRNFIDAMVGIINVALGLLGIVAVIVVLAGGFKWMTAGGNDDKVAEARKLIVSGIIGLAIIFSAWAITKFVITQLARATESGAFETFEDF